MSDQQTSKDVSIGCYVMDGVIYISREDGSETSRKATAEEVLLADAHLRATDELRGCSRELAIERRARSLADRHPNSNGTDAGSNPAGRSTHEPRVDLKRYFQVKPVAVTDEPKACRLDFHVGVQTIPIGPEYCEDSEHADWWIDIICKALQNVIAACSAPPPEVAQCPTCLEAHELLTRALIAADNNADGDLLDKVHDAIEVMERAAQPPPDVPLGRGDKVRIGPNIRGEYSATMTITHVMYTLNHGAATVPDDAVVRATSTRGEG